MLLAVVGAGGGLLWLAVGDGPVRWASSFEFLPRLNREPARAAPVPPVPELPRGGRRILPDYRVVAFYGAPQADELGELGIGRPSEAGTKLNRQANAYRGKGRLPVMPAMELIATIANASPGDDGKYRTRQKKRLIRNYLKAAREAQAILILDIQPGRADFMDEVRALREFLEEPDVSIALDPEWSMDPGEVPGQQIGSTDARKVNQVADYMSGIVREKNLPQKVLLVHRFTAEMIENERDIEPPPGIAVVESVDGFGGREVKADKYRAFTRGKEGLYEGFKLFYKEDTNLMGPRQVLNLEPHPNLVIYE